MNEHELKEALPNEKKAEKPKETTFQVRDDEWKKAIEIMLGINAHERDKTTETELIVAARNFRKIIDFFVKLFGGAM